MKGDGVKKNILLLHGVILLYFFIENAISEMCTWFISKVKIVFYCIFFCNILEHLL